MVELPDPLTLPDCDVSDLPFPDELLVSIAGSDLGMTAHEVRNLARSMGWIEVPGGWRQPVQ